MAFPLAGADNGTDRMAASGFLIEVDAQIYLTTVGHLATRQIVQTDDWTLWDNELTLCSPTGAPVVTYPLFETTFYGAKQPLFRFFRRHDPSLLVDLILLPLGPGEAWVSNFRVFHLPNDSAPVADGQTATMVGCNPWPQVNHRSHVLTPNDLFLYADPQQEQGYSGCPIIDSKGLLIGMPYGGDHPDVPDRGLVVGTRIIHATAGYVDGMPAADIST